jgi:dCTP deaminase
LNELESNGKIMYDLRLGSEVYLSTKAAPFKLTQQDPYLAIGPGEFAILMTHEFVHVPPDLVGFISLRFTWAGQGLINISGFHVDPTYKGYVVFSVYNAGPRNVVLKYLDPVFMILFGTLLHKVEKVRRPGHKALPLDIVSSVKGPPISVWSLDKRLKKLETRLEFFILIASAVLAALIAFFFK